MSSVKILLSAQQIAQQVNVLAQEIAKEYAGKDVILVSILKGSFIFLADLVRELYVQGLDAQVDFMGIESYGKDTESSKNPRITHDLTANIYQRHVLVVEDIVDTGYSLDALTRLLNERQPLSLKTVVLLSKQSRREIDIQPDYLGFEIEGWIEGYGLDDTSLKGRGRPNIVVRE